MCVCKCEKGCTLCVQERQRHRDTERETGEALTVWLRERERTGRLLLASCKIFSVTSNTCSHTSAPSFVLCSSS